MKRREKSHALARCFKWVLRSVLAAGGLELKRRSRLDGQAVEPPPLRADFLSALHDGQGEMPTSFQCPLENVVDYAGFGFGKDKWHPFVKTLRIRESQGDVAAESFLESFYARHQPRNAAEAFLDFLDVPERFRELAPYLHYMVPWTARTPERISQLVNHWTERDNAEHGQAGLDLLAGGFRTYGPVSDVKKRLEFDRLRSVTESIKQHGYDRALGDCCFRVIKRGDDFRFLPDGGGYHRTAAMAALGYEQVPGRITPASFVIDARDVDFWPQVRHGVWSRAQALAYVDHLFDFDSNAWSLQHWDA